MVFDRLERVVDIELTDWSQSHVLIKKAEQER
jgi:hypothetical protein